MKRILFLIPAVFIAAALAACGTATPALQSLYRDSVTNGSMAAGFVGEAPAAQPISEPQKGIVPDTSAPADNRIVIMNATRSLVVNDPAKVAQQVAALAEQKGGWVVNSNINQNMYGDNGEKYYSGTVTIRVPADQLDESLTEIEALAVEVQSRSVSGQDVTADYVDLQAQLDNLTAADERLKQIMQDATDTNAILAVETQLQQVEGQMESIKGRIQYYDESAHFSSITVDLQPYIPSQPIVIAGWHPEGTAKEAVQQLISGLEWLADTLIRIGICGIPALLVLALIFSPFYFAGRAIIRHNRKPHQP